MRKRGWGRVASLAAVVLAVGVLGACSGDEPKPAASPVGRPSASSEVATPTLTPTPRPSKSEAAKQPTPEGAQEFVKYFLQIYTYAYATNDGIPVSDVSLPGCGACKKILDDVAAQKAKGQHSEGGKLTPIEIIADPSGNEDRMLVDATYSEQESVVVGSAGERVRSFRASKAQFMLIALRWDLRHGWRVIGAKVQDGPQ